MTNLIKIILNALFNNNSKKDEPKKEKPIVHENKPIKESSNMGYSIDPFAVIETTVEESSNMGYSIGSRSRSRLDTCHQDIITICEEVIKYYDFSVLEGLRTLEKQQEYFSTGRSKLDGVNKKSKHQDDGSGKSKAIDIIPYKKGENPFSGKEKDSRRFYYLAGIMKSTAIKLKEEGKISYTLRWGGDWDGDDVYTDQNFDDLPHFELV
jgi:peptidoglycan LD-endopeptidase CwlK